MLQVCLPVSQGSKHLENLSRVCTGFMACKVQLTCIDFTDQFVFLLMV